MGHRDFMDVLTWWFLNEIQMFAFHYVCVCVDCHLTFKLSNFSNADNSSSEMSKNIDLGGLKHTA